MIETNIIHTADCTEKLTELPQNSVHAVVTDPPYGLAFMGRSWDDFEPKEYQEWCEEWATAVKRVLKPGGHLLAFSGNRTHHRLFTGVEDAGYEIRDTITWHYGSGFPKALDVSKAIQKANGVEPEKITNATDNGMWADDSEYNNCYNQHVMPDAKGAAKRWDGFKTALKPATEYVVMARKPLDKSTVAENVQEHGTGALNIGGCRIESSERPERTDKTGESYETNAFNEGTISNGSKATGTTTEGRYPSNVVFDETQAEALDASTDDTVSTGGVPSDGQSDERHRWAANVQESTGGLGDSGGVSRYFYTSKASKAERTENGKIDNAHPTVKPVDLMEWLVKLITAENQIVLDPFVGSGTTCKAAKNVGRQFVGIEKQKEWADVARVRAGLTPNNPAVVREDELQEGLEDFA